MAGAPKSVLITGTSSGFGKLTAIELARRGWRVFATMRTPSKSADLEAEAVAAGVAVEILDLDVSKDASVQRAFAEALRRVDGALDAVVNNAGYGLPGAVEDLALDEVRALYETNTFGPVRVMQAVLPAMRARGRGTIVNVSSAAGTVSYPGMGAYSSSKAALDAWTYAAAAEVAVFGIRICLVCPGTFNTPIFRTSPRPARMGHPDSPYTPAVRKFEPKVLASVQHAPDPRKVARVIARLCQRKRPPFRVYIGPDAKATELARRLVPAGWLMGAMRTVVARALRG